MPVNRSAERAKSRDLRSKGRSLKSIAKELGVSPSSVKVWTDDIELSADQRAALDDLQHPKTRLDLSGSESVEDLLRRAEASNHKYLKQRLLARAEALNSWEELCKNPALVMAIGLYIGEGRKAKESNEVSVSSVDPKILKACIDLFEFAGVRRSEMFVGVHLPNPPSLSQEEAVAFWAKELNVEKSQFQTPRIQNAVRQKEAEYPHGVCYIGKSDISLKVKIDTWMELAMKGF
jgi:predicted transcriptional regulator